jgi:AcrR family transcriptional regulator
LLAAAESLLVERGYKGMTIDDIAETAGIGKGTVYLAFKSKMDLACEVVLVKELAVLARLGERRLDSARAREQLIVDRVMLRYDAYREFRAGLMAALAPAQKLLREVLGSVRSQEERIFALAVAGSGAAADWAGTVLTATESLLPVWFGYDVLGSRDQVASKASAVARALVSAHGPENPALPPDVLAKLERLRY